MGGGIGEGALRTSVLSVAGGCCDISGTGAVTV